MKYDKLIFIYPFSIGSFLNAKIGLEATLEEGDNINDCFDKLSKEVKHIAYREQGGIVHGDIEYSKVGETTTEWRMLAKTPKEEPEERRIGDIVSDIQTCTDIKTLESYRIIAKTRPEFQKAYDEQKEKLQNQPK